MFVSLFFFYNSSSYDIQWGKPFFFTETSARGRGLWLCVFYKTLLICNQLRGLAGQGHFQTGYFNNFTEKKT